MRGASERTRVPGDSGQGGAKGDAWLIAAAVASAVDGGWFGWKVLRGFRPDGAVLELYTGLALKTRRQPAFAPETNLTLASSILPSLNRSRSRASLAPGIPL